LHPKRKRKELAVLCTVFKMAARWGVIESNPAEGLEKPPEPKHRTGYLSHEQEKQLLEASPPWLCRIIRWAINTGMDRGEIVLLTWDQIDNSSGTIDAPRSKTRTERHIPLNETLRGILKDCRKVRSVAAGNRIFLDAEAKATTGEGIKSALLRSYKLAGLSVKGPFKIFRHTFGSRLAMNNATAQTIAALMGHTDIKTTMRYMHLSPSYLREAMNGMDTYRTPKPKSEEPLEQAAAS
jgi:integrase